MAHRSWFILTVGLFAVFYIYFGYFYLSDSKNILLANQKFQEYKKVNDISKEKTYSRTINNTSPLRGQNKETSPSTSIEKALIIFPEYNSTNSTLIRMKQESLWNLWLKTHNFISVGRYYNHCDDDKIITGEFVMVPNSDGHPGVKFQSYLNVTWGETIESGTMYVDVWYGGIRFIKYRTSLCAKRKSFKCPLIKGISYKYVVDFNVPFYVPSGQYKMKVYAENYQKKVLLCFIAEAII